MTERYVEFEGNNGGSIIAIRESEDPGMVHLTVGSECVWHFQDEKISVVALALALSAAKDHGFQRLLDEKYPDAGWRADIDPIAARQNSAEAKDRAFELQEGDLPG